MADPADAAEDRAGPRQTPTHAAMMSAFSMFPQEEEAASPVALSQPSSDRPSIERSPWDDTFRRMIVPADVPLPEAKPRPSPARFGAIGTWQLSTSPIAMPPPPATMKLAAPARAPEPPEPVIVPEEPEPKVPEPERTPETPEPEPPIAVQALPETREEPEWIERRHHAPAADLSSLPELLPLYGQVSHTLIPDPLTQAVMDAEPIAPPSIAAVSFDPTNRLNVLPTPAGPPLFGRLIVWQVATAASLVLAVAAGVVAFVSHRAAPLVSVAAIGVVNAPAPLYLAEINSAAVLRLTALATIAVPNGRDLQLWIIPQGDQTPTSLGVLSSRGTSFTLPVVPPEGTRFVISMEPRGGTTAGRITGQVLYGGTLANR